MRFATLFRALYHPAARHARRRVAAVPWFEVLEDRSLLSLGFTAVPTSVTSTIDPSNIVAAPDGNLWFTATSNQLGTTGSLGSKNVGSPFDPTDITVGPDESLWFTESGAAAIGKVSVLPNNQTTLSQFPLPSGSPNPLGIAPGSDGNLWFTVGSQIDRMDTNGNITGSFGVSSQASEITADPDGNLWFTEPSGLIGRITTGGAVTEFGARAGSLLTGITPGPDGNLWFTEAGANRIGRITTGGAVTEFAVPTAGSSPTGITMGPDGNLWFTELATNKLGRITPDGSITEFPLPQGNTAVGPSGITAGPDGNLWLTWNGGVGQLSLLSASATPVTVAAGKTFSNPVASFQAFDPGAKSSDFNATVNWGDGSSTGALITGNASSGFTVSATHTYSQPGSYSATATITNSNASAFPTASEANAALPPLPPSSASATIPVTVNAATHLGFQQQPGGAFAGQPLNSLVVAVEDANNQVVTTDNSTVVNLSIGTNADGATLGGPLSARAVNGLATFNNVSFNRAGAGYTLVASTPGLSSGFTAPFNITAIDAAVGSDNQTRLVWDNLDGRSRIQTIDDNFNVSNTQPLGPITGWTVQRVATGSDGLTRVLWTKADGSFSVFVLNSNNTTINSPSLNALPGETAIDVAVGKDNQARLLWDYADGRVAVGTIANNGAISNVQIFGPFAGWSGAHLAVGNDGLTRLLWTHTSGAFAVWLLNADNSPHRLGANQLDVQSFSPQPGLTATDVAVGADGNTRLLLDSANGQANVWTIASNATTATFINQQSFASPGYLPTALASGGTDGLTRLVWDHQDGSVALYLLDANNAYVRGTSFGPWTPGASPSAPGTLALTSGSAVVPVATVAPAPADAADPTPPALVSAVAAAPAPGDAVSRPSPHQPTHTRATHGAVTSPKHHGRETHAQEPHAKHQHTASRWR